MATKEQIIGTWNLASIKVSNSAGELSDVFGDKPAGMLIYTDTGHISVQVMHSGRPLFASADSQKGTDEEIKAAFEGMSTYFGTYDLGDNGTITHCLQSGSFPNDSGSTLIRHLEISGEQLIFKVPPMLVGGDKQSAVLIWERVKKRPDTWD